MKQSTITQLRGDGIRLAADVWEPSGTPAGTALLLHGGGQTRHSWQRTGARLAEHGWRALTIDARGHGDSDWADDGDYSHDAHARDLRQIVADLGETPVLVGASMGGLASLHAAGADPSIARALVLVDITPTAEPEGIAKITGFMRDGLDGFDSLEDALDAVVAYNPHRSRPPRIEGLRKNLRERDGRWYWHWDPRMLESHDHMEQTAADREERAREAARAVRVPTLLIRGKQSDVVSDDGVRELLRLIPGARLIDVTGAGHMVSGDDNDVLSSGLIDFLDGVAGAEAG
ncbi:alpha/beta hydrolase [Gordonia sp. GONU]|uniref:Alpha/beta hydrolase n=1 Tax=Gordonia amicalis TaxID=89053 RepID=A0AAE4R6A3_9ACTN|nr:MULTISPECIES: alpha/beta hydrolase [Gordonia]MCR8899516.1 alpha/beta hydrolase [Gordonia sp. GONU]MCZ0912730.1 alpha/beta hydrolase [Gordonia amicalis]MCZ4652227.1 alpha/beta hydrolase [Gordonia amicalis]MDV6314270.1 alpha/beta hydrolase [Gordonia amicalis]